MNDVQKANREQSEILVRVNYHYTKKVYSLNEHSLPVGTKQVTFVVSTHLALDCRRQKYFFHVPMRDGLI